MWDTTFLTSKSGWAFKIKYYPNFFKNTSNDTSIICKWLWSNRASQVVAVVKNPPANAGDVREVGSVRRSGRSPGEGNGSPLQYSCLENPMDRGAWRATAHGITKSQTQLKRLSTQTCTHAHKIQGCISLNCSLVSLRASGRPERAEAGEVNRKKGGSICICKH